MTSASAVSATLHRAGFLPVPSGSDREGLRVRQSLQWVRVTADFNRPTMAAEFIAGCEQALRAAGYTTEAAGDWEIPALLVTKTEKP